MGGPGGVGCVDGGTARLGDLLSRTCELGLTVYKGVFIATQLYSTQLNSTELNSTA